MITITDTCRHGSIRFHRNLSSLTLKPPVFLQNLLLFIWLARSLSKTVPGSSLNGSPNPRKMSLKSSLPFHPSSQAFVI